MKNSVIFLLVLGLSSSVSAGTMVVYGLPSLVDTSGGPVTLSFDIISNGQLDNDSIYIWAYGATLDIDEATNNVVPGEIYDDSPIEWLLDIFAPAKSYGISLPILWADIAIVRAEPRVIVGDIISDIGLTIPQSSEEPAIVMVLTELTGEVQEITYVETAGIYSEFPNSPEYSIQHAQWVALGEPSCWYNHYGTVPRWNAQCYGDAAADIHARGYVVYTSDLLALSNSWKAKIGDANLNPCADFAHKSHPRGYVVYTDDLTILSTNWKKKWIYFDPVNGLPGGCPRTDSEMGLK